MSARKQASKRPLKLQQSLKLVHNII